MAGKPLLNELKILRGTNRADRVKGVKTKAHTGPIRAPKNLPAEAKKLWKEIAPQLQEQGLLTSLDVHSFALLCVNWAVAVEAGQKLEEEGLTRKDENGVNRKSIYLQILRDATASFRPLAAEFGLTPAGRAKLTLAPPEKETLADKLNKAANS